MGRPSQARWHAGPVQTELQANAEYHQERGDTMKCTAIRTGIAGLALTAIGAGCGGAEDESLGTATEPILNGTPLDDWMGIR